MHLQTNVPVILKKRWFPLRPVKKSSRFNSRVAMKSSDDALAGDMAGAMRNALVTGSIKLRLQWVHTATGLLHHIIDTCDKRTSELDRNYNIQLEAMNNNLQEIDADSHPANSGGHRHHHIRKHNQHQVICIPF